MLGSLSDVFCALQARQCKPHVIFRHFKFSFNDFFFVSLCFHMRASRFTPHHDASVYNWMDLQAATATHTRHNPIAL
jgi:hypothetical protein